MRVEVLANDFNLSAALRRYASARVWLAIHRFADRLSWVRARFTGDPGQNGRPRVTCQIDVWVKGAGVVTVRHIDTNPYVGVDCAAVRLRQTLASRLRHADDGRRKPAAGGEAQFYGNAERPRLAVVVAPAGRRPRLGLRPWLRTRYGVEQLHTISVSASEWDGLASDHNGTQAAELLKERLALSLLGRPELVVVAGCSPAESLRQVGTRSPQDVGRIAERIRSWSLPVEVVGVWVRERWEDDVCVVESEEVGVGETADAGLPGDSARPHSLAEFVWENEGGRLKHSRRPARPVSGRHRTTRRNRHDVSDHRPYAADHPKAGQGSPPRDAVRGPPGLRPNPARLAHS